jgi:large subunit ribosomal protein L27
VKLFGGELAKPGAIIIRQRGTKWHPGKNVGMGNDYTIFALKSGRVMFDKGGRRVNVVEVAAS